MCGIAGVLTFEGCGFNLTAGPLDGGPGSGSPHERARQGTSEFEAQFVERVLVQVPELDPEMVSPHRTFRTAYGRDYRVDFTIEDRNVRIAVEVDGYDKTGRGKGMTRDEHDAWVAREGASVPSAGRSFGQATVISRASLFALRRCSATYYGLNGSG